MKQNHNRHDAVSAGPQMVPVRFEFTHLTAQRVCVAGSFNEWEPTHKTLHSAGGGMWWKETSLAPGTYEYCFIVDGQWIPDPLARETVPNPYGGLNSVLTVTDHSGANHRADAQYLPLKNSNSNKLKL